MLACSSVRLARVVSCMPSRFHGPTFCTVLQRCAASPPVHLRIVSEDERAQRASQVCFLRAIKMVKKHYSDHSSDQDDGPSSTEESSRGSDYSDSGSDSDGSSRPRHHEKRRHEDEDEDQEALIGVNSLSRGRKAQRLNFPLRRAIIAGSMRDGSRRTEDCLRGPCT